MTREFDLNIERVLENWAVAHALREVIANAIDEQALTGSRDPEIFADSRGCWHIRDWGRGVRYEHLTQNENQEKLANPDKVVGKFGVGLKDALATFDRHDITVTIRTRHGDITTGRQAKHGFDDIQTLHALISEPADLGFTGTEFILCGDALGEREIKEAKALFLRYAGDEELGRTTYGSVLRPQHKTARARIYVNGLRVAEEDNFLFSYNITSPTAALRRALNRERSNVGRGAYTDRVKAILLACDEDQVVDALIADLENYERGSQHDETQWLDVGLHACRQLNARRPVIFLTASELALAPDFVQRARVDGYQIVVVPDSIRAKLRGLRDPLGNPMRDLERYRDEWHDSFVFTFITTSDMTTAEREIWHKLPAIFATRGGRPSQVRDIRVSETMRLMDGRYQEAAGLWDEAAGHIIIKRTQLQSLATFAGTVLHEVSHALSRAPDMSLDFEQMLTEELGAIVARQFENTR
ncbi:MAG TPA: hypothetical protein VFI65_08210 [Streptosporangiaceae bacterium]|nr:hypothetical protein [Streptosporangiaceae bacterium]